MSLDVDIPYALSRKMNLSARYTPHIFWDAVRKRWAVTFSNSHYQLNKDLEAQNYVNTLNRTKQAHPII